MSEVTICIPARKASSRLPNKLLIDVDGKPLIQYTIENLTSAGYRDIVVATDSEEIGQVATTCGTHVVYTDSNLPNGTSRIYQALSRKPEYFTKDWIVNVQGDEPLLDIPSLHKLIESHTTSNSAPVYTLCHPISYERAQDPSCVKCVFDDQGRALYFSRSPIPYSKDPSQAPYFQHIGVYSYQKKFLHTYVNLPSSPLQENEDLEQLKILEKGYIINVEIAEKPSIGIDTLEDLHQFKDKLCKQNIYS